MFVPTAFRALVRGGAQTRHQSQRRCLKQERGVGVRRRRSRRRVRRGARDAVRGSRDAVQDDGNAAFFFRVSRLVVREGLRGLRVRFRETLALRACVSSLLDACFALEYPAERVGGARRAANAPTFERARGTRRDARALGRHTSRRRDVRDVRAARDVQERVDDRFRVLILRESLRGHASRLRELEVGVQDVGRCVRDEHVGVGEIRARRQEAFGDALISRQTCALLEMGFESEFRPELAGERGVSHHHLFLHRARPRAARASTCLPRHHRCRCSFTQFSNRWEVPTF